MSASLRMHRLGKNDDLVGDRIKDGLHRAIPIHIPSIVQHPIMDVTTIPASDHVYNQTWRPLVRELIDIITGLSG
jgi:hypothetical protein